MVVYQLTTLKGKKMTKPELCEDCGDEVVTIRDEFTDATICKSCENRRDWCCFDEYDDGGA